MIKNFKLDPINIDMGLCEIRYGDTIFPSMASDGVFQVIPKYKIVKGGIYNEIQGYLLEEYEVSFEASFNHDVREMMQFYLPQMKDHNPEEAPYVTHGLLDDPSKIKINPQQLIIHPYKATNRESDICIWNAFIDPETSYKKVFGKEVNKFNVRFIGKRILNHIDSSMIGSYFYMGDWMQVSMITEEDLAG